MGTVLEVLPTWAVVSSIALTGFFGLRAVSLIGALLPDDEGGDVPTRRTVLLQARRGVRSMGFFLLGIGALLLPSSPAPFLMGVVFVAFPALMNADALKVFIPASDHDAPIGPPERTAYAQSYARRPGPLTLEEWLQEP